MEPTETNHGESCYIAFILKNNNNEDIYGYFMANTAILYW